MPPPTTPENLDTWFKQLPRAVHRKYDGSFEQFELEHSKDLVQCEVPLVLVGYNIESQSSQPLSGVYLPSAKFLALSQSCFSKSTEPDAYVERIAIVRARQLRR